MAIDVDYRDPSPITESDKIKLTELIKEGNIIGAGDFIADFLRHKTHGVDTREALALWAQNNAKITSEVKGQNQEVANKVANVEKQFADQIEGSTNDDELINYRHSDLINQTFDTAKKRGDFIENDSKERSINAAWYGIKGDGKTDDTDSMQTMFESIGSNVNIIFPQKSTILVSKPIIVKGSHLNIDFNGSTLKYTGTQSLDHNNGSDRYYGALMFIGDVESTVRNIVSVSQYTGWVNSKDTAGHDNYGGQKNPPDQVTRIELSAEDAATFSAGDYAEVTLKNYNTSDSWSASFSDNPAQLNGIITRVLDINGNFIYCDFSSEFIFDNIQLATMRQINPKTNIKVSNLNFIDGNETEVPDSPSLDDKSSWVSGLKFIRCANVEIERFRSQKQRFPAISMWQVHDIVIDDFKAKDSKYMGPGCGYGITLIACTRGRINNGRGRKVRHLVDLSASGHIFVNNCHLLNDWLNAFDCHGVGEFDINFNDCSGNFLIGNNLDEFPCMTASVNIDNCQGALKATWIYKLKINRSLIRMFDFANVNRVVQFSVVNSTLTASTNLTKLFATARNSYTDSFMILNNTSIVYSTPNEGSDDANAIRIEGYNTITFSNIPEILNNLNIFEYIQFLRCSTVKINGIGLARNVGFYFNNNSTAGNEVVSSSNSQAGVFTFENINFDNKITLGNPDNFINIDNMTDVTRLVLNFIRNNLGASSETRWLRINTQFKAVVNANANVLRGNIGYASIGTAPNLRKTDNIDSSSLRTGLKIMNLNSIVDLLTDSQGITYRFADGREQDNNNYNVFITPSFNSGALWVHDKKNSEFKINWQEKAPVNSYLNVLIVPSL